MIVLSLGAGVQSTTMALMAAHRELVPMPDCAIFADTQSEPSAVYKHLDWLETILPFPVHRVTVGSLRQELLDASQGKRGAWGRPPLFILNQDGTKGMTRRQCTGDYKIVPIERKVRELVGIARGSRGPKTVVVEQWIGISTDEAARMKPSSFRWIKHRWPLIDLGVSRQGCLRWLATKGYPKPTKSACTFCPYHSDAMWRDMRDNDPESFADAVTVDRALRDGARHIMLRGQPYLHRQLKPLDQVDLSTAEDRGQINMFNDDCTGLCGV